MCSAWLGGGQALRPLSLSLSFVRCLSALPPFCLSVVPAGCRGAVGCVATRYGSYTYLTMVIPCVSPL